MRAWLAALLTLGLCLVATAAAWRRASKVEHARHEEVFRQRADQAHLRLVQWLNASEQLLWGVRAVFASSPWVERVEFREYVDALVLPQYAPGIQAVGFSKWVPAETLESHERVVRESMPGYAVRPPGPRPGYGPIMYIAPYVGENQRALGYDMFAHPLRREAMELARDECRTVATRRLQIGNEAPDADNAAVIMYLPIYRRGEFPEGVAERRETLVGWTYVALRIKDLVDAAMREDDTIDARLYEGPGGDDRQLLYSSTSGATGSLSAQRSVSVAGREWTLVVRARREFDAQLDTKAPLALAVTGALMSLVVSALVFVLSGTLQSRARTRELELARQSLQKSEQHFRAMAEHAPVMIFTAGIDFRWTWVNGPWASYTGRRTDELLGEGWLEVVHPDDRDAARAASLQSQSRRSAFQAEWRLRRADGSHRWILVVAVPFDESGWLGSCVDIHEHRESEARLAESEWRLRLALKGGDLATWEFDLETRRMTFGERFVELVGLTDAPREWTLGQLISHVHQDDRPALEAATLAQVSESLAPFRFEMRVRHEGGYWVWVLLSGMVVLRDAKGAPLRLAGTLMDLTERKRAERERELFLERFTRAERAAALGTLASGMAHEINNPLAVVLTNVAFARWQLEGPLDEKAVAELKAALDDASEATTRVRDLVAELRALPVTADEARATSDLRRVLERAQRVAGAMKPARASVTCEVPPLPPVRGGEGELVQLFSSLLTNAVQATTNERPNAVHVSAERQAGLVRVVIVDRGKGMPPEVLRQVFDPFFTTRGPGGGKGLGVSTSVAIARALGGTIEFERSSEEGTTVVVTLPLAVEEARSNPGAVPP